MCSVHTVQDAVCVHVLNSTDYVLNVPVTNCNKVGIKVNFLRGMIFNKFVHPLSTFFTLLTPILEETVPMYV